MKITRITVQNLLGARAIELDTARPVNVIAGSNGAGKSSIRDAVRLAMTANLSRVALKRDLPRLITDGAKVGRVTVETGDGDTFAVSVTSSGKVTDSHKGREACQELDLAFDAQRVARMPDAERKAALLGLLNVQLTGDSLQQRLLARGARPAFVDALAGYLRAGNAALACEQARDYAAQSRGAWKAITGETYGATKASTWKAPTPAFDGDGLDMLCTHGETLHQRAIAAAETLAKARAAQDAFDAAARRLADARTEAEKLARAQAKLDHDTAELAKWTEELAQASAAAGEAPRVGLVHDLARALSGLLDEFDATAFDQSTDSDAPAARAEAVIKQYVATHGPIPESCGNAEARDRLPQLRSTVELMQRSVANATAAVAKARAAAATVDELTPTVAAGFDSDTVTAAQAALTAVHEAQRQHAAHLAQAEQAKRDLESAARKTQDAQKHHGDVVEWSKLEDLLSPDGVPGEILTQGLEPLLQRLQQTAADTGWPLVTFDRDMRILFGGRPYYLLSESEQWRADAALAEALGYITGTRLLVLDRMDVLDMPGRAALVQWLNVLATTGELDTALVFATLRAAPGGLPEGFAVHWIDAGTCMPASATAEAVTA